MTSSSLVARQPGDVVLGGGRLTATGIVWSDDATLDGWQSVIPYLKRVSTAWRWWVGDWLSIGEERWGEKYDQAVSGLGLEYQAAADMAYVSRHVPITVRNENLSWTHHRAVAKLSPADQAEWLERCLPDGDGRPPRLTAQELRAELKSLERSRRTGNDQATQSIIDKVHDAIGRFGSLLSEAENELGERTEIVMSRAGLYRIADHWRGLAEAVAKEKRNGG